MRSCVLVTTRRGGIPECQFRGSYVVVRKGRVIRHRGESDRVTFFRSAAKPFQALACLESGAPGAYGLAWPEVALMAGSHTGETIHLEAAAAILHKAGVDPAALLCGVHVPASEATQAALARAGERPTPLHNNCSGKHAGMLAGCRHLALPLDTYLELDHPYQKRILQLVAGACGVKPKGLGVGIDGCSAPNFAVPLSRMAAAYAGLATAGAHNPRPGMRETGRVDREGRQRPRGTPRTPDPGSSHTAETPPPIGTGIESIAYAMQAHPEMVEGPNRFTTDLMRTTHGRILAKVGAEGVFCVGVCGEEIGIALKFDDGSPRFIPHLTVSILEQLGLLAEAESEALLRYTAPVIRNHRGLAVGEAEVRI